MFEMAGEQIGVAPHRPERAKIRIDQEPGVGGIDSLVRAVRIVEVDAFHVIRPQGVGRERDGAVRLTEYFCIVVGCRVLRPKILVDVGVSVPSKRIGIVGVDLERLFEQGARRLVFFLRLLRWPRQGPATHGEIDGVGVPGTGGLFRFRLDEFDAQRIRQPRHHLILQLEQVGDVFLEAVGPEMRAGFCVDELGVDPHPVLSRCTEPSST